MIQIPKKGLFLLAGTMFLTVFTLWIITTSWRFSIALMTVAECMSLGFFLLVCLPFSVKFFGKMLSFSAVLVAAGYFVGAALHIGKKVFAPTKSWEILINAFSGLSLLLAIGLLAIWLWLLVWDLKDSGAKSVILKSSLLWMGRIAAGVILFGILKLVF